MVHLLHELYDGQLATVRTEAGNTEWFGIEKGVRQGCIISPDLFNLYGEMIMRQAGLADVNIGMKIAGRTVNNLRYADDTTLLANSTADLEQLVLRVKEASEKAGLFLNLKKTKVMSTAVLNEFKVNNEPVEVVDAFNFLGAQISTKNSVSQEIRRRIGMGKAALQGLTAIMKDRGTSKVTKVKLVQTLVFPVFLYGCETWTLNKSEEKRVDSFELWCWRRLLRIPWTARRTNISVLQEIGNPKPLIARIVEHQLKYFGHVVRAQNMESDIMLGTITGSRKRGRPRTRWLDKITLEASKTLGNLLRIARNRDEWRELVKAVARCRSRRDGTG